MKRTEIKILVLGHGKRPRKLVADLLARAGYTVTTDGLRAGELSATLTDGISQRVVVRSAEEPAARTPPRRAGRAKAMNLQQLREHVRQTQGAVARRASVSQPQLSRVEGRRDHLVSTVRKYVRALGGDVQVIAEIGPERIVLRDV